MTRMRTNRRPGRAPQAGFTVLEMVVAMVTLGGILAALTGTQIALNKYSAMQLMRSRCVSAAEAQIERLARTGEPMDADLTADRWPGVTLDVDASSGQGQWAGLRRVEVTARGRHKLLPRPVEVSLYRYLPAEDQP